MLMRKSGGPKLNHCDMTRVLKVKPGLLRCIGMAGQLHHHASAHDVKHHCQCQAPKPNTDLVWDYLVVSWWEVSLLIAIQSIC